MLPTFLTRYYGVDIIAMCFTFVGLYLIGNKKRFGFVIAAIGNSLWITLGTFIQSYGIIIANAVIIALYTRGFLKWKKTRN